jgi:hypothetical protein
VNENNSKEKCFVTGGARAVGWGRQKQKRNETEKYFNFKPRHAPHSIIIQDDGTAEKLSRELSFAGRKGKLRKILFVC